MSTVPMQHRYKAHFVCFYVEPTTVKLYSLTPVTIKGFSYVKCAKLQVLKIIPYPILSSVT